MADMIADGLAWLNGQMRDNASVTMTYRRGANSEVDMEVTIGGTKVNPLTVLAGVMADRDLSQPSPKHVDHPFYFNAEDFVLDDELATPQDGDTMEITIDDLVYTYILAAPLDGGRSWRSIGGHESGSVGRICWNGRLKSVM